MMRLRQLWTGEKSSISVYRCTPPDGNELIVEVEDSALAEFMIMDLEAKLGPEQKEKGVFHYRWVRFEER